MSVKIMILLRSKQCKKSVLVVLSPNEEFLRSPFIFQHLKKLVVFHFPAPIVGSEVFNQLSNVYTMDYVMKSEGE